MKDYIQQHLGAKLFLSYLAAVASGVVVLIITSQSILPSAFTRHMMGSGMNGMMGMSGAAGTQLFTDFRASFNEALTYSVLAAVLTASLLSILLSRSLTVRLAAISSASQRIAEGRFGERVEERGSDELAQLALRFNQMAERLDQVEAMRRQLIADVSHELRTPLTAIKGSMEGLIDGVLPATHETFQQIHTEADRLNRLVDDLQELSRVEGRAYALDIRPLDVPTLIQTVSKRLSPQAQTKHISLQVELAPNLPQVLADEDRTIQVLTNLVGNALQYTLEKGKINIAVKRVD